jgi:hypothetical protein
VLNTFCPLIFNEYEYYELFIISSLDLSAVGSVIFPSAVKFVKFNPPVEILLLVKFCPLIEVISKGNVAITNIQIITTNIFFMSNNIVHHS